MSARARTTGGHVKTWTEKLLTAAIVMGLLVLAACANPVAPEEATGPSHTTSSGNHTTSSGNLAPR